MSDIKEKSANENKNLKDKAVKGFKWSLLDNVGRFGGQFVIGLILTRLLSPADYGLVGMLYIFIVIGQSLTNSGFGQALIQKQNVGKTDFSTVFYFNILTSVFIYFIIYLCSPLIAKFYNEPQLVLLTKVISLSLIVNALGLIQIVYLEKKLEFKAPSIIGIISVLISGGISIYLAYDGFGVWALVVNNLLKTFITTVLLWKVSKWRPTLEFSMDSLKNLFSYGSKILVAGLIQSIFDNIYYLIIGRFFPVKSLGYYTRATQFRNLPIVTLQKIIHKVTYPLFSKIQDDEQQIITIYTKVIRALAAGTFPLLVLMIITSKPLIHLVLGEQWLPTVPYLQLMCLYPWILVLFNINNQIITAKGRSDYYLYIQIIDKILIAISIAITYKYGITALIYGHMVVTVLSYLIGSIYLQRIINLSIYLQLKNIFPFLVSALVMLGISFPLAKVFTSEIQYLIFSVPLGLALYILILWLLKVEELHLGLRKVKSMLSSNSLNTNSKNSHL